MQIDTEKLMEIYLKESPWLSGTRPETFNKTYSNIKINTITSLPFKERFNDINIYEDINNGQVDLYGVVNNELACVYSYYERESAPIKTKLTWNSKKHNGYLRKLFGDYIIPKFKVVESDTVMSDEGFNMWMKLIGSYPKYKFYSIVEDKLTPLKDPYDVHLYKEKITDPNSSFLVFYNSLDNLD